MDRAGQRLENGIQRPASQAGITPGQLEQKPDARKENTGKQRGEAEKANDERI